MRFKFGKVFLEELEYKLGVVSDTPELREDYNISENQLENFTKQISSAVIQKKKEIDIPDFMVGLIKGEMLKAKESKQ